MPEYAIVQSGAKQYRVQTGDTIRVESIPGDVGDTVELTDVRMVSQDGDVTLGNPTVDGAKVVTEIEGNGKAKKIIIFKKIVIIIKKVIILILSVLPPNSAAAV